MTDISKHKLIKDAYEVCQAIEKCGASVELTDAVSKASQLMHDLAEFIDKYGAVINFIDDIPKKESYVGTNKYRDIDGTIKS